MCNEKSPRVPLELDDDVLPPEDELELLELEPELEEEDDDELELLELDPLEDELELIEQALAQITKPWKLDELRELL